MGKALQRFQRPGLFLEKNMRTTTATTKAKAATKAPASTSKPPRPTRKTKSITLTIPGDDLAAFTLFADHFGLTPEMVMEKALIGQLEAMGDCAVSSLAYFDELPAATNPAPVTLSFIPEAHALLELVSRLIRRPLEELAGNLLWEGCNTLSSEMEEAEKIGGFDNHLELPSFARRVIESEFEARRGRMVKAYNGFDAWVWLQLERYRPTRLELSTK